MQCRELSFSIEQLEDALEQCKKILKQGCNACKTHTNREGYMQKSSLEILEQQELIQKLVDQGYGELIDALLMNENATYTKKGRLNKSGACRVLNWKTKQLEDALAACREILKDNLPD